ncbi:reverse transcriptase domain-containing protein [Tanacetum coccineum]
MCFDRGLSCTYQVIRGDESSKNYKILSEMLEDFDRLDVEELFRFVKERYSTSRPEGFDRMLWGDLHTLFEPDEDDEIWRDQHEYNLLSWRLCDFCGIHILLMDNGLAIHMLTEKKYHLSQEMLTKMLSRKLEVDHESSQAFELLSHEMQKLESELWNHAMVGAGHAAYTDRFHELARLVLHLVTPESRMIERYVYGLALQICGMVAAIEPKTIQKAVQISGALTDEAVRNGSIKKAEKRGNVEEPSKDKNGRDDNKRTRTGNNFSTVVKPVGRENTGDCRSVPRNVNPVNARSPTIKACYECGRTDHVMPACPRWNRAQGQG